MKKRTFFLFRVILLVVLSGVMESPTVVFAADPTSCEGNLPVGGTNGWQQHFIDGGRNCPDPDAGPLFGTDGADGVDVADFDGDCDQDIVTGWEESKNVILYLNPMNPDTDGNGQCNLDPVDHIDNDLDGREGPFSTIYDCNDGLDNDGDGLFDETDPQCQAAIDEDGFLNSNKRPLLDYEWRNWDATVNISGVGTETPSVEDAVFADVDRDGRPDFIVSATEGNTNEVFLHLFSGDKTNPSQLTDSSRWTRIKLKEDAKELYMRVQLADLDGDGCSDIIAGTKQTDDPSSPTGDIGWWKCPAGWNPANWDPTVPNAITNVQDAWGTRKLIASDIFWIMELEMVDMDNDGDLDVLFTDRKKIGWMKNPLKEGGDVTSKAAWNKQIIETDPNKTGGNEKVYRWSAFVNITGDSRREILVTTVYGANQGVIGRWYEMVSTYDNPDTDLDERWASREIVILGGLPFYEDNSADEDAHRQSKAIVAGDVDANPNTIELVFTARAGEHEQPDDGQHHGSGLYYLTFSGSQMPTCDPCSMDAPAQSWVAHSIAPSFLKVKYDNLKLVDLDIDGDLDVISAEENATLDSKGLGVVWYENYRPPTALDDFVTTSEDMPLLIDVLNNERDSNFNPASVKIITGPSSGSAQPQDGKVLYTPAPNFNGSANFTYQACNADNTCREATVTVNVIPVNDAPTANHDAFSAMEGQVIMVSSPGILGNDGDVDGDGLSAAVHIDPAHGDLTLASNGGFSYAPVEGFCGVDSFIYAAYDGRIFSNLATTTINVACINDPPVAHNDTVNAVEDTNLILAAPGVLANDTDPDGNALTAVLSANASHGMVTLNPNGSFQYVPAANYCGPDSFTYLVNDGQANSGVATVSISVACVNDAPALGGASGTVSIDEGQTAVNSGTVSDVEGDLVSLSASVGAVVNHENGTWSWSGSFDDGPAESQTITITADDGSGGTSQTSFTLVVNNVAPTLNAIGVDTALVPVNTEINASASFTDPGVLDTHSAGWDWGDGTSLGTVTQGADSGSVDDSHSYSIPGVYTLKLTVTDNDGGVSNESAYQFVVVYDPSGGFVTGGGWFNSPAGAYKANETLTGNATFGFVAKYKNGANVPDGNTEFQFEAGDLNFKSTSYEWLVVAGNTAQFKGEGTVSDALDPNGNPYKFILWAGDGESDTFRIRIWWEDASGIENVVYDNGSDQPIGGGNIVVHKGR